MDPEPLKHQFRKSKPYLIISFCLGLTGMACVYILHLATNTPLSQLTRDPVAVFDTTFYVGILSNMGIFLWTAATTICFFTAIVLLRQGNCDNKTVYFLIGSGLLSFFLTLDDLLLFHEQVFPYHFQIPQKVVMWGYVIILPAYLLYFSHKILKTNYLFILFSLFFLSASTGMDQILLQGELETFCEDGLKFFGIIFWLVYFYLTTMDIILAQ